MNARFRKLESEVARLQGIVAALISRDRPVTVRSPIAGDPLVAFKVSTLHEPDEYTEVHWAECVRTNGPQDAAQTVNVIVDPSVSEGEDVFASRMAPYCPGDPEAEGARWFRWAMPFADRKKRFVRVMMDGGAAGSDGVFATYTYEIFNEADVDMLEAIAGDVEVISRLIPVELDEAPDGSIAEAVWDSDEEVWKIVSGTIAEVATTALCDEEEV